MHDGRRGWRAAALVAALMAGAVAITSAPSVIYAQSAPAKPAKAAAGKKKAKEAEDPKRGDARKQFEDGEAKFAAGDFAGAAAAYKAANELVPAPQTLYKIAVSLDKGGKAEDAMAAYGAYLAEKPGDEAKVAEAQGRVAELKKSQLVVVSVKTTPPGASVSVDGQAQTGTTPLELKLPPGSHAFHFSLGGYDSLDRDHSVAADAASLELSLSKTAPPPSLASASAPTAPPESAASRQPEAETEHRSNTTAYVLLGVTAACVGVGTVFGVQALQAKSDFDNGMKTSDQADKVEQNALISDLLFGTALTLGVTGAVLLFSNKGVPQATAANAHRLGSPSRPALEVVPAFGPHQAAATARIRF